MPWFEDFSVGDRAAFGRYEVTREEVLDFARRYDPQPFHLDDAAAAETYFGRVSASGWHSCAMMMAMIVAEQYARDDNASLGALGIDALRWKKPVYPGDTLRCAAEILETRASRSMAGVGSVRSRVTVLNQHDEPVMTLEPLVLYRMRPVKQAPAER